MTDDLFDSIKPISAEPSQYEIDSAITRYSQFEPNYVWAGIRTDIRNEINSRWREVKEYSERNFPTEFRQHGKYHSRLHELNIRYLFRDKISRSSQSREPDIVTDDFVIECVVPAPIGVPEPQYDGRLFDYPTDQISRRVTTALVDKLEQFNRRILNPHSNIDYSKVPYMIGIGLIQSSYLSARHMNGMDIVEALMMGAGPLQVTINSDGTNGQLVVGSQSSILNSSGAEIPTAFFQREEWKVISAVLWTSKWYPEECDIKVLLNPNANIPFDASIFGVNVEVISYTKVSNGYNRDQQLVD